VRQEPERELVGLALVGELVTDLVELLGVRELEVVEEVTDLLERGLDQVVDVVSDVGETTLTAVDVAERGLCRYDTFQSLPGRSHLRRGLSLERSQALSLSLAPKAIR
jgi:hypothetical protein